MPRFKSIISRIISLHVIAIGVTSICMPLALYGLLSATANDLHERALREHADSLSHYLKQRPQGGWSLDLPAGLQELYAESYGRYSFAILDEAGHPLFSSIEGGKPIFPADPLANEARFISHRLNDTLVYGASVPEEVDGRRFWIQVTQDLAHRDVLIDDIVADFFVRVGWITLPILLVLLTIDILIFRRALHPVLKASEMTKAIGPAHTDIRLSTEDMPREIQPLVKAVNEALERLEQGFRTQREFTADAAHELRTPLTILRTRIDTLGDRAIARSLRDDIAGMTRIVNQLLDIAELEGLVPDPGETADLQAICAEVAAFVAPLAVAQDKSIALSGTKDPVRVRGNHETLFQAIRNLAENAISHTPAGTTAEIEVTDGGMVHVLDEGPGIPESERELIFRRFWRRDRRRAGSAGLGLAIVSRIVEAYGGTIAVRNGPSGGAVFAVTFPLARDG